MHIIKLLLSATILISVTTINSFGGINDIEENIDEQNEYSRLRLTVGRLLHEYLRDSEYYVHFLNINYKRSNVWRSTANNTITFGGSGEAGINALLPGFYLFAPYVKVGPEVCLYNFYFDVHAGMVVFIVGYSGMHLEPFIGINSGYILKITKSFSTELEIGLNHSLLEIKTYMPYISLGFVFN